MVDLWVVCETSHGYTACCIVCKKEEIAENLEYAMHTYGTIIHWFATPVIQINI